MGNHGAVVTFRGTAVHASSVSGTFPGVVSVLQNSFIFFHICSLYHFRIISFLVVL